MSIKKYEPLSYEALQKFAVALKVPSNVSIELIYEAYSKGLEGFMELCKVNALLASLPVNHIQLWMYLFSEHIFYLRTHPSADQAALIKDEHYIAMLSSMALDKYVTNEHLALRNSRSTSLYNPELSTIMLYLNFILGMLSRYQKNDPSKTLLVDIMNKAFSLCRCIISLLAQGFETEAFSTWRTLHENECILAVLVKYGDPVIKAYLTHLKYALAFRGGLGDKEKTDEVFLEIKEGMRNHELKSKDMKRYIEYGWLYAIPDEEIKKEVRLNFRDGVETVAGLHSYSKVYEMSSELAHSSPLLIYSRKNYFYLVTLLNLHESFSRLEKIFSSLYLSSVSDEEKDHYLRLRQMYFPQMKTAYELAKTRLVNLSKKEEA